MGGWGGRKRGGVWEGKRGVGYTVVKKSQEMKGGKKGVRKKQVLREKAYKDPNAGALCQREKKKSEKGQASDDH